jgi:phenylacetate-CoA ligase
MMDGANYTDKIITTPMERWIIEKSNLRYANKKSLEEYQLNKIRDTIKYVKEHSKYYQNKLKDIIVDDIKSISDLNHIPFTLPRDLETNYRDFLCIPQRDIKRIVTLRSSGTLSDGKRIFFSQEDLDLTVDFFRHGMDCLTNTRDRILVLLPGNSPGSIGDLLKKAMDLSGKECFALGVLKDIEETSKFIIKNKITCIVGVPLQVLLLARSMGDDFRNKVSKVLLSTDYVPQVLTKELTEKYGCKVFNHYGMTEMGYGGGVECEALNGYHMREADLYFEIIDPVTGQVLPDGEYGEVVFTSLTRKAMPLVRYRTGDMAAFSTEKCRCNTFLRTMKKTLGRIENRIPIGNNCLYMWELDEVIFKFDSVIDYTASLEGDKLAIVLAEMNPVSINSKEVSNKVKDSIESYLVEKCGPDLILDIEVHSGGNFIINPNTMIKRKLNSKSR